MRHNILNTVILFVFIASCQSQSQKNSDSIPLEVDTVMQIDKVDTNITQVKDYLSIAREYSENYNPQLAPNRKSTQLRNTPDTVVNAFKHLKSVNINAEEKYLTLILLKVYREHLQCCHQSYELRSINSRTIDSVADPLLYEYNLLTRQYDNKKPIEFISSDIGYNWTLKHKRLLQYNLIAKEIKLIESIQDSITKGIYWE